MTEPPTTAPPTNGPPTNGPPTNGPRVRTDLVLVHVFRNAPGGPAWLQLRRAREPMAGTWQPIMGHIEPGETAAEAARRELAEETGLRALPLWQVDSVFPFFLAGPDEVYLSPAFVAQAAAADQPVLDEEHNAWRWVGDADVPHAFAWPFQIAAIDEARALIQRPSPGRTHLRIP